jgi:hypothetical protein
MAKDRQLSRLTPGEYQATCFWESGSGIEQRTRYAENAGIKVEDKWVYIYLRNGEEVVKLSRTRNQSAQVYIDMTLRQAIAEKVSNSAHSAACCHPANQELTIAHDVACMNPRSTLYDETGCSCPIVRVPPTPCKTHTPQWFESAIDERIASLIADEQWSSVLAQRVSTYKEVEQV